jgi:hypothetical protein
MGSWRKRMSTASIHGYSGTRVRVSFDPPLAGCLFGSACKGLADSLVSLVLIGHCGDKLGQIEFVDVSAAIETRQSVRQQQRTKAT